MAPRMNLSSWLTRRNVRAKYFRLDTSYALDHQLRRNCATHFRGRHIGSRRQRDSCFWRRHFRRGQIRLFGCAQAVKTSSAGLSLTNGGLTVLIRDASGNLVTEFSYGGSTGLNGGNAQSLTRSPRHQRQLCPPFDTGRCQWQKILARSEVGRHPFGGCPGHPASVSVSPSSTTTSGGNQFNSRRKPSTSLAAL